MRIQNQHALYWHSFFLAVTMSFTEINTVMPALILNAGGGERAVGILTGIMIGLPLISQLVFAGFLHSRERKKPFLLFGINLRVVALAAAAVGIARFGTTGGIIPVVFITMAVFALSGAFAGVSYTDLVGKLIRTAERRRFFVRRQVATSFGLLVSAIATRVFLGQTQFPNGYVVLFAMAATFLLVATAGFWMLRETPERGADETATPPGHGERGERGEHGEPGGTDRRRPGMLDAFRQVPSILTADGNMRGLIAVVNLAAPAFTAIPLITALAHRSYDLSPGMVGTFVLVQIIGMVISNAGWSYLIRRGGFRMVIRTELVLLTVLFPVSLGVAGKIPVWLYAALYLIVGAIVSAQRLGVEATVVQISPEGRRALYAGVFGAANLGTAVMPLLTGSLAARVGFPIVFGAAAVLAATALVPLRSIWCGEWYRDS